MTMILVYVFATCVFQLCRDNIVCIHHYYVVLDSKCDYPAACNAMEVLLLHASLLQKGSFFTSLISTLREHNVSPRYGVLMDVSIYILPSLQVTIHPGPRLHRVLPMSSEAVSSLRREYGSLECCIEIVDNVSEAVDHINNHGSHHTDCVITENGM